mgnify:CR=1 FL=1
MIGLSRIGIIHCQSLVKLKKTQLSFVYDCDDKLSNKFANKFNCKTSSKFEDILAKHGIEKIDETNVPFDVNLHDALLRQPATDEKTPSDTVLQVLERGYRMGEKVIKHAKVIVSQ